MKPTCRWLPCSLLLALPCFLVPARGDVWRRSEFRIEPGPLVKATKGGVWPKPQQQITLPESLLIRPKTFNFTVVSHSCDILEAALGRYTATLRQQERARRARKVGLNTVGKRSPRLRDQGPRAAGYLDTLLVNLGAECEALPYLHMDEHYELRVNTPDLPNRALLASQSIWGILRGLETWSQLVYSADDATTLLINSTSIMDFPRFPHRGMHLDTARHFMPVRIVLQFLDAMAMNKFNVFHWHIVDDQSFPYSSVAFPKLTEKGAYSPMHVYTQQDVARVIEEARLRGIRVIPEFDTPGHTRSWGEAYPELLTPCYEDGQPDGTLGPINPIRNETYAFMDKLLREVKSVFRDDFIHLGGDEVPFDCWLSNPEISNYMKQYDLTPEELEEEYIQQVIDIMTAIPGKSVVWQEVFDNGVKIQDDTVVHVWKSWNYESEMANVTKAGYKTILSGCWYLDYLANGGDWVKYYACDPYFFAGTEEQRRLVLGGEACMWAEAVDANNVLSRVWPRACAPAEKLWSASSVNDPDEAAHRLEEHACRMNRRGIPAQPPNGPGFCPDTNYL